MDPGKLPPLLVLMGKLINETQEPCSNWFASITVSGFKSSVTGSYYFLLVLNSSGFGPEESMHVLC